MSLIVLLDSGPLGLVTNPKAGPEADACKIWLRDLPRAGHLALAPEITDYEIRRELCLYGKIRGLQNLDRFRALNRYLPLTTDAMQKAADFWAEARRNGIPTADRMALDADVILAAQAATLDASDWNRPGASIVIATTNVGHLSRFVDARLWQDIPI